MSTHNLPRLWFLNPWRQVLELRGELVAVLDDINGRNERNAAARKLMVDTFAPGQSPDAFTYGDLEKACENYREQHKDLIEAENKRDQYRDELDDVEKVLTEFTDGEAHWVGTPMAPLVKAIIASCKAAEQARDSIKAELIESRKELAKEAKELQSVKDHCDELKARAEKAVAIQEVRAKLAGKDGVGSHRAAFERILAEYFATKTERDDARRERDAAVVSRDEWKAYAENAQRQAIAAEKQMKDALSELNKLLGTCAALRKKVDAKAKAKKKGGRK